MRSDLRQIRYFIATAEELHFRRAAERLGIAQPALSRTIRDLEQELGVTLFQRSNRHVQITEAGKVFLDGCRDVVATVDRMIDRTCQVHEGRAGILRIGYTDMAISGVLPRLLKDFREHHPEITLKPQQGPTVAQLQRLHDGELDIGFVTGPIYQQDYAEHCVQSERFVCVCADSHPFAMRDSVHWLDLAGQDIVHGNRADWAYFYDYMLPQCRDAGFEPRVVQEGFNTAGILGLVACGMGVTILTDSVCATLSPDLRAIPILDAQERLKTMALWPIARMEGPARFFVEFLQSRPEVTI